MRTRKLCKSQYKRTAQNLKAQTKVSFQGSDGCCVRLQLLLIQLQFRHQLSDAVLELAVLGGVDERVDDAVGEHHYIDNVVVPQAEVDSAAAAEADCEQDAVRSETCDETTAYHQRSDSGVACGCVYMCRGCSIGNHLKNKKLIRR